MCVCVCVCVHTQVSQLGPTLCGPMNYSPPGSSAHGIFQAKVLEWVAISFSRGFSQPRIDPVFLVSPALAGEFFTDELPGKPPDVKSRLIGKNPDAGKDWGQEEKGMTDDEMVGWHHWFNGYELGPIQGDGEGQGSLVCCSP